ncbi:expressed unknown protein [Seminavis robusta]|uniref:Uncharacterized protein n=1 Tax=Seminavis robusta TaxID=568900 RepID=A0A9N8DTM5_9STRA|nr:expressed unknown protein [Seminavis robusta]|eukprot:Sro268_g103710.1 n/a (913) ;mRNA; f:45079-47817
MAHDNASLNDSADLRKSGTPTRQMSSDSAVSRDEHLQLRSKLRGLRRNAAVGGIQRSRSNDSQEGQSAGCPRIRRTLSSESSNHSGSHMTSDGGALSGMSNHSAASMASAGSSHEIQRQQQQQQRDDRSMYSHKTHDSGSQSPRRSAGHRRGLLATSGIPPPRGQDSSPPLGRRGLSRRSRLQQPQQQETMNNNSDHSNNSPRPSQVGAHAALPSASAAALEKLAMKRTSTARGTKVTRGLGGKRISTTRVVEPNQVPMVSTKGLVSPLPGATSVRMAAPYGKSTRSNIIGMASDQRSTRSAIPQQQQQQQTIDQPSVSPRSIGRSNRTMMTNQRNMPSNPQHSISPRSSVSPRNNNLPQPQQREQERKRLSSEMMQRGCGLPRGLLADEDDEYEEEDDHDQVLEEEEIYEQQDDYEEEEEPDEQFHRASRTFSARSVAAAAVPQSLLSRLPPAGASRPPPVQTSPPRPPVVHTTSPPRAPVPASPRAPVQNSIPAVPATNNSASTHRASAHSPRVGGPAIPTTSSRPGLRGRRESSVANRNSLVASMHGSTMNLNVNNSSRHLQNSLPNITHESATNSRHTQNYDEESHRRSTHAHRPSLTNDSVSGSVRGSRRNHNAAAALVQLQQQQMQEHQQKLHEPLYQPTQEDWAVLYKRHVEELERKDLEIAMKLSTRERAGDEDYTTTNNNNNEDDEGDDEASLGGIELALEVSRRETQQTDPDEEEMLQMVLQMSRNENSRNNHESSFGASFAFDGGASAADMSSEQDLSNADLLRDTTTTRQQDDPMEQFKEAHRLSEEYEDDEEGEPPLTEEEQLERILRLSQEEHEREQQQRQQQQASEEDEELMRILRLSEQEHQQQAQQQSSQGDLDDELLRALEMSQKEALDQEKERDAVELVLELSRQHTTDTSFW